MLQWCVCVCDTLCIILGNDGLEGKKAILSAGKNTAGRCTGALMGQTVVGVLKSPMWGEITGNEL